MKTIVYGLAALCLVPGILQAGITNGTANFVLRLPDLSSRYPSMNGLNGSRTSASGLPGQDGGAGSAAAGSNGQTAALPAVPGAVTVKINSVSRSIAFSGGAVSVTMTGENFSSGIVPALKQAGQTDIPGQFVNVISSAQLTCQFDLTDATTGCWDVTIPSEKGDAVLANEFQVFFPSAAVREISRGRAYRIGIETPHGIVVADIPAGAFAENCVLSLFEPPSLPGTDPGALVYPGMVAEVVNDKHLPQLKDITLTFYFDVDRVPGLD